MGIRLEAAIRLGETFAKAESVELSEERKKTLRALGYVE